MALLFRLFSFTTAYSDTFNKQAVQLNCWTKRLDLESSIEALEHSETAKRAEIDYNILLIDIVTNGFRQ